MGNITMFCVDGPSKAVSNTTLILVDICTSKYLPTAGMLTKALICQPGRDFRRKKQLFVDSGRDGSIFVEAAIGS